MRNGQGAGPRWSGHDIRRRAVRGAVASCVLAAACLAGACSEQKSPAAPSDTGRAASSSPFIVSSAYPLVSTTATTAAATALGSAARGNVAYVSLPPASIPDAALVSIALRGSGISVTAPAVDGGFDPVAVSAAVGDTIDLVVTLGSGGPPARFSAPVVKTRPVVVRTSPPAGKRDVPLNATIIVVFSAPIAPSTLNGSTVKLTSDANPGSPPVSGQLAFADSSNLTALFTPGAALAESAAYTLAITQGIEDANGQPLAQAVTVQFSTEGAATTSAPPPTAGLVAYYKFDGSANDASGNGGIGTVSGATLTTDRFGIANRAYFFDGVSASITTTTQHFAPRSLLSVSLWAMAASSSSLFAMSAGEFNISAASSQIGLTISHPHTNTALGILPKGTWVHFVGTFDGQSIRVYTNGQLVDWLSWPGAVSDSGAPLVFGQFGTEHWLGSLDDVRIYNRVLSLEEVQQLYHESGWSSTSSIALPPPPSSPRVVAITYQLTGTATSDDGQPVIGAQISALYNRQLDSLGTKCNCPTTATTDAAGHYTMSIPADSPGGMGLLFAPGDSYEEDNQAMIPVSGTAQTFDFHVHRMQQIAAGDSTLVTVDPSDSYCFNDLQKVGGFAVNAPHCRVIEVMPAADGVLHVNALSTVDGSASLLEMEDAALANENLGNPGSVRVAAGKYVRVSVEIPFGAARQTFLVRTSITPQ